MIIPDINVDAPIILPRDKKEYTLQRALEQGVIYWPESSLPNEEGVITIIGHSSAFPWYKGEYGSIFSLLNKLEQEDEIILLYDNKKYTYKVASKEIKAPKVLDFKAEKGKSVIYLVSCWPLNTDWRRIVIKAIRVDKS